MPFASAAAYDKALDVFLRAYTRFVRNKVSSWLSFPASKSRLVWTQRDLLLNGLADFDELHDEGLGVELELHVLLQQVRHNTWQNRDTIQQQTVFCNGQTQARKYCLDMNIPMTEENMDGMTEALQTVVQRCLCILLQ